MYKYKILTSADGTAKNQEMYEWLTANCSDLFDSITINSGQTRVSCNVNGSEVIGLSSDSAGTKPQIYWKGGTLFDTGGSMTTGYGKITRLLRLNNAFLISVEYYQFTANRIVVPAICFIKSSDDMFLINMANTSEGGLRRANSRFLLVTNDTTTWNYVIHSFNNGNGVQASRSVSNYYHNLSNTASLVQMRCTNDYGTLIPGVYWVKQTPIRDTGLITINGKEYFSNSIFCILNE